ncbi:MAG: hypothetical protein ACO2Y5_08315 [Nitrosopumilaceae archaeon]
MLHLGQQTNEYCCSKLSIDLLEKTSRLGPAVDYSMLRLLIEGVYKQ